LGELAAEAGAAAGLAVGEVDDQLVDVVARRARSHGVGRRVVDGVWFVERKRWKTTVDSPVPPERIRRVLFDLAAERSPAEALATAAADLGLAEDVLRRKLFADRQHLRTLVPPAEMPSAGELAGRYNLALVQSFAVRSTELVALVREQTRRAVGFAKLLGMMVVIEEHAGGALSLRLSGPLAIFHDTLKYGRALASWFPALVATSGWSLSARVILRGEALRLDLDASAPVARTHALSRAFDSKLEAALDRDLRRLGSRWRIERESAVIRAAGQLFYPDFALISEEGRVLVEVVGFWTPEYLAGKARMLDAARASRTADCRCSHPLIMCVDERHGRGFFEERPDVIFFRDRVDATALVAACERALEANRDPPPASLGDARGPIDGAAALRPPTPPSAERPLAASDASTTHHYLILPETASYATYAVRAGARREHWRLDLLEDIGHSGQLRIAPSRIDSTSMDRARLLGRKFELEVFRDRLRTDALFAYRVGRAPATADANAVNVAAVLTMHAPGTAALALPTTDPVAPLLSLHTFVNARPNVDLRASLPAERFVGRELEFEELPIGQASDSRREHAFRNRTHLEGERNRVFREAVLRCFDDSRAREPRPAHIRRKRDNEDGLEHGGQLVALPDDDGSAAGLLERTMAPEIRPPDLATFHRRSSAANASAHSARPASASARSSPGWPPMRSRSQRAGSDRRSTRRRTRSPGRKLSG
jgi:predicted nuclease of restriction endonuclease-like RecB superfamily